MPPTLPPTLQPGDRVAVLSPSWCAPAHFPALHEQAILQITPAAASCDYGLSWDDPRSLTDRAPRESVPDQWSWSGPATVATGPTWGGNLEVLQWILAVGRDVLDVAAYQGCVLLLETSEEHPPPAEVYRMMRTLGERGLLGAAAAILVARPAACERADDPPEFVHPPPPVRAAWG